jgi:hypothetical protein
MANFDGLVVSLRSSRALARRTYPFLTERGRELGADADDCVSSRAGVCVSVAGKLASRRRQEQGSTKAGDVDGTNVGRVAALVERDRAIPRTLL